LDKESELKEGLWKAWGEKKIILCFCGEKENECVRKKLAIMYEEVLFMETNGV
jgi:hypothetical protein